MFLIVVVMLCLLPVVYTPQFLVDFFVYLDGVLMVPYEAASVRPDDAARAIFGEKIDKGV